MSISELTSPRFSQYSHLKLNLIAGLVYLLVAIGVSLAIAPLSVALTFFPAAGWALAMALVHGLRVLPGIALGVLGFQLYQTGLRDFSAASLVMNLLIVCGVLAQAFLGAFLAKWVMGPRQLLLITEREIIALLVMLPVVGLISASVGVSALSFFDLVGGNQFFDVWRDWWIGDVLGLVLIAPPLLRWMLRPNPSKRMFGDFSLATLVILPPLLGLVMVGIGHADRQARADSLREAASAVKTSLVARLKAHETMLESLRTWFLLNPSLSYRQFGEFTESVLGANKDVAALSFNAFVTSAERVAFEARMSESLGRPFIIKARGPSGVGPAQPDQPNYVPVTYIAPLVGNEGAVGFDIGSDPVRRAAIEAAILRQDTSVTKPIRLVQDNQPGVLVLEPIVKSSQSIGASASQSLMGFSVAVVRLQPMLQTAFLALGRDGLRIQLFSQGSDEPIVTAGSQGLLPGSFVADVELPFFDQYWRLTVSGVPTGSEGASFFGIWAPLLVLLAAILLQMIFLMISGRHMLVVSEVQEKTGRLAERQAEIERSQAAAKIGTWTRKPHLGLEFSNEVRNILQRPLPPDMGWKDLRALVHPDDVASFDRSVRGAYDRGEWDVTVRLNLGSHVKSVWLSGRFITQPGGGSVEYGTIQDVTELRASLDRFQTVMAAATDGIVLLDSNGALLECNPAAQALGGWSFEQLLGKPLFETVRARSTQADPDERIRAFFDAHPGQLPTGRYQLLLQRADATEVPVDLSVSRIEGQAGRQTLCVLRDISVEMEARRAIEQAKDAALSADRAKSEFLAVMSHELRTPMNAIIGLLPGVLKTKLTERQREDLLAISQASNGLMRTLNDILDFSSLQAGASQLRIEPVSVRLMGKSVTDLHRRSAEAKGLDLLLDVSPDCASVYDGDVGKLRQVLDNFVGNAIKFTQTGSVKLRIMPVDLDGGVPGLRVECLDTGIGVPEDAVSTLFDRFTQADTSIKRRFGGTGLGLSICKQLVTLMGGTIGMQSSPDGGSMFWFELPMNRTDKGLEHEVASDAVIVADEMGRAVDAGARLFGGEFRVLVVDDNQLNRLVVARLLEDLGVQAELVDSGRASIERLADLSQPAIDLVLMDLHMPEMGGLEATRKIRSSHRTQAIPIVALTAAAYGEDRDAALSAGMNGFIVKPLNVAALADVLHRYAKPGLDHTVRVEAQSREAKTSTESKTPTFDIEGFDLADLKLLFGSDLDGLRELLKMYGDELAVWQQNWQQAIRAETPMEEMEKLAHSLIGSSGNCGDKAVCKLARSTCDALRGGEALTEELKRALLDQVDASLQALRANHLYPA